MTRKVKSILYVISRTDTVIRIWGIRGLQEPTKAIINSISGPIDLIEGTGKASFILPNGTKFFIKDALFSSKSKRNLLSFNDIYLHGYDTQSATEENMKYMYLTTYISGKKYILEKLSKLSSGLYYTYINMIESLMVVKKDTQTLTLWYDRLGHPDSIMMRKIIENSHGYSLKGQKILQTSKILCELVL